MVRVSQNLRIIKQSNILKKLALKIGSPVIATNPEKLDVLQFFVENPHIFIRRTTEEHQIDQKLVCKILKPNKFHPYNIHLVQELNKEILMSRVL